MFGLKPLRRPLVAAFPLATAAAILVASAAVARELEPGATLEGFPFPTAYSVAMTADGLDLYASAGKNFFIQPTPGLAWLRRDPVSGRLEFRRNYFSEGSQPEVYGSALSADDSLLFVLRRDRIESYRRAGDGSLAPAGSAALAANFQPQAIRRLPHAGFYVMGLGGDERIYGAGAEGQPVLLQTLTGANLTRDLTVVDDDLLLSGNFALKRQGGLWVVHPLASVTSAISFAGEIVARPDRRYFYAPASSGPIPFVSLFYRTLEKVGDQLVEVGTAPRPADSDLEDTAAAVHPATGRLYVANIDTNGSDRANIHSFSSLDGGKTFTGGHLRIGEISPELSGLCSKHSLTFSPDGRHLYATFDGEPMALFEVGESDGALTHVPDAAGPHSHFERPSRVQSLVPGEVYFSTPRAILHARWDEAYDFQLVSSLEAGFDALLALAPDGLGGAAAAEKDVKLLSRNASTGRLQLLPGATLSLSHDVEDLVYGANGYVYAVGATSTSVLAVDRLAPALSLHQVFPLGGKALRLGLGDAVLLRPPGDAAYLRVAASGELSESPFCCPSFGLYFLPDARFARGGQLLYLFDRGVGHVNAGVRVLRRTTDPQNPFTQIGYRAIGASEFGFQAVAGDGSELYRLKGGQLELMGWASRGLDHQLRPLDLVDGDDIGPMDEHDFGNYRDLSPLAVSAGGSELVLASQTAGNLRLYRRGCGALEAGPCLADQRFRVRVTWRDAPTGFDWPAEASPIGSAEAQVFTFFDSTNWEMMVKVLDGCGINDRFWVYAAASTDVGFTIEVTDTWTGQRKVFSSPAGAPAPAITDGAAFATCGAADPGWSPELPTRPELVERPEALELGPDFRATASWTVGTSNRGQAVGLRTEEAQASGLFYFFSPDNWELQVKVLDGCAINGYHWVFGAATTDVGYTLEVTENSSGRFKLYTNPIGTASKAIADIQAFSCN